MVFKDKAALINALVGPDDVVLDVGFWGQGVDHRQDNWVHGILKRRAKDVYGVDTEYDDSAVSPRDHYQKTFAENTRFPVAFDVVFCGDVIEHLPNPGLFLESCKSMLAPGGKIVITTPNCFNLFNMFEKISKQEPTVNSDHVAYYNAKTLRCLLQKSGFSMSDPEYLYSLGLTHKESWKKKLQNGLYAFVGKFTDKFMETLVVSARKME
jgi:SAM-dependent methyltransferase